MEVSSYFLLPIIFFSFLFSKTNFFYQLLPHSCLKFLTNFLQLNICLSAVFLVYFKTFFGKLFSVFVNLLAQSGDLVEENILIKEKCSTPRFCDILFYYTIYITFTRYMLWWMHASKIGKKDWRKKSTHK